MRFKIKKVKPNIVYMSTSKGSQRRTFKTEFQADEFIKKQMLRQAEAV